MSAKEMFEKLGYMYQEGNNKIECTKKYFISETNFIIFDKQKKNFTNFVSSDSPFTLDEPYILNIEELQAINKQVEELGWLDANTSN